MLKIIIESNRAHNVTHSKLVAVMMCMHPRLGCLSKIQSIPVEVLRSILESFVRMYAVVQASSKRLMSSCCSSPDVFWLMTHFSVREVGMPNVHCCGRIRRHILGSKNQRLDDSRLPFAGDAYFSSVRDTRVVVHKHAYVMSNFQRFQDWYFELFACARRFSLQFMATDRDYNFLLFEPAFAEYKTATIGYRTVDGSNRPQCLALRRRCSAQLVMSWLCDLWGHGNCERYVRVRQCQFGLQILVCGREVEPDAIFQSNCFNHFRRRIARNEVLCI